ncbi:porin PorA family protein [Streptomyces rectiviolaceus]|uniref:DUF3068 domain-containing protein n=1 Tax=Streptomyces rectiviolaceus TaxID=332591 RepID=A0ABP6M958_9ACTN
MSVRRTSLILVVAAVVLAALSGVVRFVVAPNATKLPDDTDQTVHYAGKATMLDGKALQSGDTANAIKSDIPITVDRRVHVTSTHGDTVVLKDALTMHVGDRSLPSSKTYSIDRDSRKGTTPPTSAAVEPSQGALSSAFPPDAEQNNSYTYYDSTTQSIVPVRYTGTAERKGRAVNVYKITVAAPVKDPAVLKPLPPALPKNLVTSLAPGIDAKALPDPVPLAYRGESTLVAYVDQQTGIAIDQSVDRKVVATTAAGGKETALLPLSAFAFSITPESQKDLADKAASAGLLLTLLADVTPLVLLGIAAVLLLIAFLRRRKRQVAPTPSQEGATAAEAA